MIFNLMKPVPVKPATMYLYGHEADKTVTYNGVELPELPVWDKETYPYAYISQNSDGTIRLYFTAKRMIYYNNAVSLVATAYTRDSYTLTDNEWVLTEKDYSSTGSVANNSNRPMIWASADVFYMTPSDKIFFEGSDPITTYENADVIIGGVGYVGAVLPKLPEWDKTVYPYAVIANKATDVYYIDFRKEPLVASGYYSLSNRTSCYILTDGVWVSAEITTSLVKPIWANHDVYNTDGTVYLSASDPIPVYE